MKRWFNNITDALVTFSVFVVTALGAGITLFIVMSPFIMMLAAAYWLIGHAFR